MPALRAHEVENWALNAIDYLLSGQPHEDSRVEFKAQWPLVEKAARRIAGQANAARGAPILWIIGVDETNRAVVGVNHEDLANWYPQVKSQFDGLAPTLSDYNVPCAGKTVVALLFDTDRAPFVVKNPAYGNKGETVELEVPWREGTRIRSARRDELLRLLSPLQALPKFEVLDAELQVRKFNSPEAYWYYLEVVLYVESAHDGRIVIPFHRIAARLDISIEEAQRSFEELGFSAPEYSTPSLAIGISSFEALIEGPGKLKLRGHFSTPILAKNLSVDATVIVSIKPVNAENAVVLNIPLIPASPRYSAPNDVAFWKRAL